MGQHGGYSLGFPSLVCVRSQSDPPDGKMSVSEQSPQGVRLAYSTIAPPPPTPWPLESLNALSQCPGGG